jgi:hypothetical protein
MSGLVGHDCLVPADSRTALESLPGSSSAGYPYLAPRGKVFDDVIRDVKSLRKAIYKDKAKVFPCMGASRRSIQEIPYNKPRLVWAYPGAVSAIEAKFTSVLEDWIGDFKQHGKHIQWMDNFKWFEKLFNPHPNTMYVSLDFKGFDASVPAFIVRDAFHLLRQLFELTEKEQKEWDFVVDYFIHTPLMLYGDVYQKHRGIPSGSCFTSIIGTLVNMLVCHYLCDVHGYEIVLEGSYWLGDDSRFRVYDFRTGNVRIVGNNLVTTASTIGMEIHPDKSSLILSHGGGLDTIEETFNYGSFLSREIHFLYPQLRFNATKVVAQAFIPEHPDKSYHATLDRLIGLCYAFGFHWPTYVKLKSLYEHVCFNFGARPGFDPRIVTPYFRMLNTEFKRSDWVFPSFEKLHTLYFGYS